jgi:hypothetical protein
MFVVTSLSAPTHVHDNTSHVTCTWVTNFKYFSLNFSALRPFHDNKYSLMQMSSIRWYAVWNLVFRIPRMVLISKSMELLFSLFTKGKHCVKGLDLSISLVSTKNRCLWKWVTSEIWLDGGFLCDTHNIKGQKHHTVCLLWHLSNWAFLI